ncbi:MAG: OsmC family protein [Acidaminococcaceae bacterium]|nr:OsmC family protein [Acidaminococcaceae bacterium]
MITVKSKEAKFLMEVSNGTYSFEGDVPAANGGSGQYVSPFELLRAAFACCLNVTTRAILDKRNIAYKEVEVQVDLEEKDGTLTFAHKIIIDAELSDSDKAKYAQMAFAGCHVHKALEGKIVFGAKL